MIKYLVIFYNCRGVDIGAWLLPDDFQCLQEAVDYIYEVIILADHDEYLKTERGGVKIGNISHWTVVEN